SFGGGSDIVPERYENLYTAGVTLSQPLYTGGGVTNGVRSARALSLVAAEGVRLARLLTIAETVRRYYAAALSDEVREVRSATYELARKHYQDVVRRRKAETASEFDVLRAKVAMQNQEAEKIASEGAALRARVALLRETGLPQDSRLVLVTPIAKPMPVPDLRRSLELARERRSEIRQAEESVRAGEHGVRAARAGYYPSLTATARWGGEAYDDPFAGDNFNEAGTVGLELRWHLFDGLLTRSRVAGARAELARLRWERKGLERDTEAEVRGALVAVESSGRFVRAQGANVSEAAEALRLAEVRQEAGTARELDVQDARDQLERARLNYVRSLYEHSSALLDYYWATGVLDSVDWSSGGLRKRPGPAAPDPGAGRQ
ncbi:MAG: TolC family protein, partial [Planctomycetota bacterium]